MTETNLNQGSNDLPSIDNFGDGSLESAADALVRQMTPEESKDQPRNGQDDDQSGESEEQPSEEDEGNTDDTEDSQDDQTDQSKDDDNETPEGMEDVEYEGKTYQVPAEIKGALMRDADYRKKTSDVADKERIAQYNLTQAQMQLQYAPQIAEARAKIIDVDNRLAQYSNVDWQSLRANDQVSYMEHVAIAHELRLARDTLTKEFDQLPVRFKQEMEQGLVKRREEATKEVVRRIPGWNNARDIEVAKFGQEIGFNIDELRNGALDPRIVQVLDFAEKYSKLQKSKPQITNKVPKGEQKVVKPGATQGKKPDQVSQAKAQFNKTKSPQSAEALMEARLLKGGY